MLLRWLAWLRLDISVGPSWIGRTIARWMLDCFLPERERYISPAVPRYPMMPGAPAGQRFPVATSKEMQRLQWQLAMAREQDRHAALNAYLHAHPDVMRLWLDGWPGGPPGPVR